MDRRSFLSWVGVGFLASSLPVAIAACSTNDSAGGDASTSEPPPPPPGAIAREDGFFPLGPTQALDLDGFLAGEAAGLSVIVVKDESEKLVALESVCPHAQCIVEWKADDANFACPCHGSKFNFDGSVASGPATSDLASFDVKIEEDIVLIKPA